MAEDKMLNLEELDTVTGGDNFKQCTYEYQKNTDWYNGNCGMIIYRADTGGKVYTVELRGTNSYEICRNGESIKHIGYSGAKAIRWLHEYLDTGKRPDWD